MHWLKECACWDAPAIGRRPPYRLLRSYRVLRSLVNYYLFTPPHQCRPRSDHRLPRHQIVRKVHAPGHPLAGSRLRRPGSRSALSLRESERRTLRTSSNVQRGVSHVARLVVVLEETRRTLLAVCLVLLRGRHHGIWFLLPLLLSVQSISASIAPLIKIKCEG